MGKNGWGPWGLSVGYLRACRTGQSWRLKGAVRELSSQRCCAVSCVRSGEVASKVRSIKARRGRPKFAPNVLMQRAAHILLSCFQLKAI